MNSPLMEVALSVAERIADLLRSGVTVLDERGTVIACVTTRAVGTGAPCAAEEASAPVQVPIRYRGHAGCVSVALRQGDEAVSPRLARALIEMAIDQVLAAAHMQSQHELKNTFILDLLHGHLHDEEDIVRQGQILGMDFSRPRAVILIDASDSILSRPARGRAVRGSAHPERRAQAIIDAVVSFFHLPSETICAHIGDGEIAVLKASSTQDLVAWTDRPDGDGVANPSWADLAALKRAGTALLARLRAETGAAISIGIGRYHPGVLGLVGSYEDARAALSLGRRFHGRNQVHCLDGLGVAAFVGVADEVTKVSLAAHLLSPLDHEPDLLETLAVFFDHDCCPSKTGRALSIHRNTLAYRLDKIASLSGLDPRHFDHAVQIRLALLLRDLHARECDCASA